MYNGIFLSAAAEGKPLSLVDIILISAIVFFALSAFLFAMAYRAEKKAHKKSLEKEVSGGVNSVIVGKVHEQGKRKYQQDSFGVSDGSLMSTHGVLAIVADGMGGLADGDKVSACAVEKILDDFILYSGNGTPEQLLMLLTQKAVAAVNDFLGEENFRKSGSTLVMGLIKKDCLSFVSVGDSRICLWRDGVLTHLNREHIYKNELIVSSINGETNLPDAYKDKSGSGLTSYLGMGDLKYVDFPASPINLLPGDKVMLMSDGIYNAISPGEICSALSLPTSEAADRIREAIAAKGYTNQDNYTGVILECSSEAAARPETSEKVEKPKKAEKAKNTAQTPIERPASDNNTAVPKTQQPL